MQALRLIASGHQFCELRAIFDIYLIKALCQLARILAETGQYACRTYNADIGLPVIKLLTREFANGLQAIEVDINRKRSDQLAIDQQWKNDAGHQHVLTIDLVKIWLDNARFECFSRASEPRVIGLPAWAGTGVYQIGFRQCHRGQCAGRRLRPIERKAAFIIAAQLFLMVKQRILAIQCVGFKY